jgi:hypothetical protein
MTGKESAPIIESRMGGKHLPRPNTRSYYDLVHHPSANSQSATSRQLVGPPLEATTSFIGPGNAVSYVRPSPPPTAQGNIRASRTMAYSMNATFNPAPLNAKKPKPANTNTNAAQPFLKAYGPGTSPPAGGRSPPEASHFGVGGGAPVRLKSPAKPQATKKVGT